MSKQKSFLKQLAAACLAASALGTFTLTAYAKTEQRLVGYMGDLNFDMLVNSEDVCILSDYLLTNEAVLAPDIAVRADLNKDQCLDARDLSLLKRTSLSITEPEEIYETVEVPDAELIPPPVLALNPTLPSVGETNILMFVVNFPDCKHKNFFDAEAVHERTFGPEDRDSAAYPLESISAYYQRSSYGRLRMNGDVFLYTAQNPINQYANGIHGGSTGYDGTNRLLEEIMTAFDAQIDFQKYDTDKNMVIDTILLALPDSADTDYWWPCSGGYYGESYFDGVRGGNLCYGGWDLNDRAGFNGTWSHELGHAMGMPDYYRYDNYDYTPEDDYGRGLSGDAGWVIMDDALGDMSAFDKLMLGWYTTDEVHIYTGGTQTFTLQSSQYAPNCLLIPCGELNDFYSEYFIVEAITPDENNYMGFTYQQPFWMFKDSGIRVLHCNAEITEGWWGPEFKWNNYGMFYDTSNQKQRVMRLVNNFGGFFHAGDLIDNNVDGFAWYDHSGYRTINPNLRIQVDSFQDGTAVVTVSQS